MILSCNLFCINLAVNKKISSLNTFDDFTIIHLNVNNFIGQTCDITNEYIMYI